MNDKPLSPFHLAIPVHDLDLAKAFYGELLGCDEGRSSESWIDFNFFGHQLVCHQSPSTTSAHSENSKKNNNKVDGHDVPIPHFGIVMEMNTWKALRDKLVAGGVEFILEPMIRFEGKAGEQATMFLLDPSGNALEFKAFKNISEELFKK